MERRKAREREKDSRIRFASCAVKQKYIRYIFEIVPIHFHAVREILIMYGVSANMRDVWNETHTHRFCAWFCIISGTNKRWKIAFMGKCILAQKQTPCPKRRKINFREKQKENRRTNGKKTTEEGDNQRKSESTRTNGASRKKSIRNVLHE